MANPYSFVNDYILTGMPLLKVSVDVDKGAALNKVSLYIFGSRCRSAHAIAGCKKLWLTSLELSSRGSP